jgi:hypothetical protein
MIVGRNHNDLEPVATSLVRHSFRIIDMQIDTERRRVFRWPQPSDVSVVDGLIHHSGQCNSKAAEPAPQVSC